MAGVEGLEPPTHGLEINYVPYPLFGISELAASLNAILMHPEASMHRFMHLPE